MREAVISLEYLEPRRRLTIAPIRPPQKATPEHGQRTSSNAKQSPRTALQKRYKIRILMEAAMCDRLRVIPQPSRSIL